MFRMLAAFLVLSANPAAALSCLPPDPVRLYEHARDSERSFAIFKGRTVGLAEIRLPPEGRNDARAESRVRIQGHTLGPAGFTHPVETDVALVLECLGPWCPGAPDLSKTFIAAIELSNGRPLMTLGPCGDNLLPVTGDGTDRLLACHKKNDCRLAEF